MTLLDLDPKILSVGELFGSADTTYVVPIYQRNYAWGVEQIEQLIDDIWASANAQEGAVSNYFLGNLIVASRPTELNSLEPFEVIDGQQRLTTLFMLLTHMRQPTKTRLTYESRPRATEALATLDTSENEEGSGIHSGYKALSARMARFSIKDREIFSSYLRDRATVVRAILPDATDLNKYFEVMNTRGEQLKQVDIVKARLMSYLVDDDANVDAVRSCFAWIWDACAEMDSYIQMTLARGDTKLRAEIFGETWSELKLATLDELLTALPTSPKNHINGSMDLATALEHYASATTSRDSKEYEERRFESPISLANLLLHTLSAMNPSPADDDDGKLDDSRLIQTIEAHFKPQMQLIVPQKQNDSSRLCFGANLYSTITSSSANTLLQMLTTARGH